LDELLTRAVPEQVFALLLALPRPPWPGVGTARPAAAGSPAVGSVASLMAGAAGAWMRAAALCTFPAVSLATESSCQQSAMSENKTR